jgi:GH18 family chitinase
LKKLNQKLSTMIALGDMTHRREKYLEMIANEETRQIFVKSVFNFLVKHDFDGLELTWY